MKRHSEVSRLFRRFWINIHETDPIWDSKLQDILKEGVVVEWNAYELSIQYGDCIYDVWISNHPYGSGTCHGVFSSETNQKIRSKFTSTGGASMETRLKLEDFYYNNLEKIKSLIK